MTISRPCRGTRRYRDCQLLFKARSQGLPVGFDFSASVVDDPDEQFYENYACGSERNYTGYCNRELERLFDQQSMEANPEKRKQLVWEIDRKLQEEGARPIISDKNWPKSLRRLLINSHGPLSTPTTAVQPSRQEPLFMPRSCPFSLTEGDPFYCARRAPITVRYLSTSPDHRFGYARSAWPIPPGTAYSKNSPLPPAFLKTSKFERLCSIE